MSLLTGQNRMLVALAGSGVVVAAYAVYAGLWEGNSQVQLLCIGMSAIGVFGLMTDDRPNPVTMDEVVDANYIAIRRAQTRNRVPSGSLTSMMEARKVILDNKPAYWEHAIRVENGEYGDPVYVLRTELMRDSRGRVSISGMTQKDDWKATERPDMVVLEPPDLPTYLRLKRMEDLEKGGVVNG